MEHLEQTELVNLCMVVDSKHDRVLVLDKIHPKWGGITFPGGHVEAGEGLIDAVKREVFEETGLRIDAPILCGIVDWAPQGTNKRKLLFLYKAMTFEGDLLPHQSEGHVFWIRLDELKKHKLGPNMESFLRVYEEDTVSEAFSNQENYGSESFLFL